MDKIYSRKRIRFPKRPHKKFHQIRNKFNILIWICIIAIIASVASFISASYPIFIASCKSAAASRVTHIVNEEVENVMNFYTYNDLMEIEKDETGKVTLMKANTVLINQLMAKITKNIQTRIDKTPTAMVYINYGSVSGITMLKNFGPKFDIELEAAGKINTQVNSKFESIGVNQTVHRIYLDLETTISVLTPIGSFGKDLATTVLLTEAVIVGDVPSTYYHLEGMSGEDTLNVFE